MKETQSVIQSLIRSIQRLEGLEDQGLTTEETLVQLDLQYILKHLDCHQEPLDLHGTIVAGKPHQNKEDPAKEKKTKTKRKKT